MEDLTPTEARDVTSLIKTELSRLIQEKVHDEHTSRLTDNERNYLLSRIESLESALVKVKTCR